MTRRTASTTSFPRAAGERLPARRTRERLSLAFSVVALMTGLGLVVASAFAGPARSKTGADARAAAKGRTLRVDLRNDFDFVDPALAYFSQSWQLEYATCAKLLNFPDKEGPVGSRPVPEVAASMPTVSPDGKTYTFTLRKNVKYNTGRIVTARDFAYAFDRDADPKLSSPATMFMEDIVGVKAVTSGKAKHISGVKVLGKFMLRIRLSDVAPDFVSRIATPFFCAVPPGTPHDPNGIDAPVPGAGPYYVASWTKNRTAVLKRNKNYSGPRPHHVDQIQYNVKIGLDAQRLRAEANKTDIAGFPPVAAAELRDRYGVNKRRFFVKSQLVVWYLNMNRERRLFKNNDALARAVNYAIDRTQMVRQHGALGGVGTDQLLPRGLPGFKDRQNYPVRGSDFRKAKAVAKGHLRNGKCEFWTFNSSFGPTVAQVVQFDLNRIGIECDVTSLDRVVELDKARSRGAKFDLLLNGWGADYPDPYDFINVLLSGRSIHPGNNINLSYFNDPKWNRRMDAAARLAGTARWAAYAKLDRDLMKGPAPLAPYVNANARILTSNRVGCFTYQTVYGTDWAALCLR